MKISNRFSVISVFILSCSFLFLSLGSVNMYGQSALENGYNAYNQGHYEQAVTSLKEAVAETPENAYAYLYLGMANAELKHYDDAGDAYSYAIKYGEGNKKLLGQAYVGRGLVYSRGFMFDKSDADYNAALQLNSNNLNARLLKARNQTQRGNFAEAIELYDGIIESYPDAAIYSLRGSLKILLSDYEGAKADINKSIEQNPADAYAYLSRGRILQNQGNKEDAEKDFNTVLQLDNKPYELTGAAAFAYHYLGRDDLAVNNINRAMKFKELLGGASAEDCYNAACLYSLVNNNDMAMYYCCQALRGGFSDFYLLSKDPLLENVRNDKDFQKYITFYWPKSIASLSPCQERMPEVIELPLFLGRHANSFSTWVTSHLRYPENARRNSIEGTVTLRFYVEKDGSIRDVKVLFSADPDLDAEAVRAVKSSPKWTPGKLDGENVRVYYSFPVVFRLR